MQANPANQNALKTTPIVFGATSGLIEAQDNQEHLTQEQQSISFMATLKAAWKCTPMPKPLQII